MISTQIMLNIDLGENQPLWREVIQAWDRLMVVEPECRDVALLMLVRRALETPWMQTMESPK